MELVPKLVAAADMCDEGEEVNLDEMAFLLRYAADELTQRPTLADEHSRMLKRLRNRVIARCDLLDRSEKDRVLAQEGALEELEKLDEELDRDMTRRFPAVDTPSPEGIARGDGRRKFQARRYQSGR